MMHVLRGVVVAFTVVSHAEGSVEPVESREPTISRGASMRPEGDSMAEDITEAGATTEADEECTWHGISMPVVLTS